MNVLIIWINKYRKVLISIAVLAIFAAVGEYWNPYERAGLIVDEAIAIVTAPVRTTRLVSYQPSNTSKSIAGNKAKKTHIVTGGDTVSGLARKYQVDKDVLATANGLGENFTIKRGQKLIIPNY